ncbi:unnamed protein product [Closterium sp. NIES-65]|nr:unnamed protein product [Closterium sp. NIES-65]
MEKLLRRDVPTPLPHSASPPSAYTRLPASFCCRPAEELAPLLLGKLLRRDDVVLRITEVHSGSKAGGGIHRGGHGMPCPLWVHCAHGPTGWYPAVLTAAALCHAALCHAALCHAALTPAALCHAALTPAALCPAATRFGPPGRAYVYLCYGLHHMLNITADRDGTAAACLVRACEAVAGVATIRERRGNQPLTPALLAGPGKVAAALALTTQWSHHPLHEPGGLELLDAPPVASVLIGPRVGIDYADPCDVALRWRFASGGTASVSNPKRGLQVLSSWQEVRDEDEDANFGEV